MVCNTILMAQMAKNIFQKIIAREVPSQIVRETDNLLVIKDIHPSAPVHLLIIPKKTYRDVTELPDELWVEMKNMALTLAQDMQLLGFRLGVNAGNLAEVPHMHLHFLAGFGKEKPL